MDRRTHDRLTTKLEVRVIDLNCDGAAEFGEMIDVSESGVAVVTLHPLPVGALVRVEFSEGTLFGQIVHVTPEETTFRQGIEIFDVLLGGSDLARLIRRMLALPLPVRAAGDRTRPHAF